MCMHNTFRITKKVVKSFKSVAFYVTLLLVENKKTFSMLIRNVQVSIAEKCKREFVAPKTGSYRSKTKFFGRRIWTWYKVDVGTRVSLWNALHSLNQWPCPALSIWLITPVFPHYVNNFMSSAEHSINLWRNSALHPNRYTRCLSCPRREDCGKHFFGIRSKLSPRISHTPKQTPAIFKDVASLKLNKRSNVAKVRINRKAKKTDQRQPVWQNKSTLQQQVESAEKQQLCCIA